MRTYEGSSPSSGSLDELAKEMRGMLRAAIYSEDEEDMKNLEMRFVPPLLDLEDRLIFGHKIFTKYEDDTIVKYLTKYVQRPWNGMSKTISAAPEILAGYLECRPIVSLILGMEPGQIRGGLLGRVRMKYTVTLSEDGDEDDETHNDNFLLRPRIDEPETNRRNFAAIGIVMNSQEMVRRLRLEKPPSKPILNDYRLEFSGVEELAAGEGGKERILWAPGNAQSSRA